MCIVVVHLKLAYYARRSAHKLEWNKVKNSYNRHAYEQKIGYVFQRQRLLEDKL